MNPAELNRIPPISLGQLIGNRGNPFRVLLAVEFSLRRDREKSCRVSASSARCHICGVSPSDLVGKNGYASKFESYD
jgi:hypothetical protein